MFSPPTRPSLIVRLRDAADRDAWQEFVRLYQPILRRVARSRNLQASDAEDVVQQVLIAVSNSISKFRTTQRTGAFRRWLAVILKNKIADHVVRKASLRERNSQLHLDSKIVVDSSLEQIDERFTDRGTIIGENKSEFEPFDSAKYPER
jgi:RNA polymerase sigma factor (sigma-70 family)